MTGGRVRALVAKELTEVRRNPSALVPVALVAVTSLVLAFAMLFLVPMVSGRELADDADLRRVARLMGVGGLSGEAQVQLFLSYQFLLLFLLVPITGAMALAAHAIVGEKQARTLEPLLATPITTTELLVGKVAGALIPTFAISAVALGMYAVGLAWRAEPGVAAALVSARTTVLVLLIGPAAALVSLQAALVVSSRVNDARTAQQFGVLIILPLTGLLVAQFSGAVWLTTAALALVGVGLLVIWGLLVAVSVAVFDRETVLTRWK